MKTVRPILKLSGRKLITSLLILFCLAVVSSGARVGEDENWVKSWIPGVGELLRHDYRRYSKEDVAAAQAKWEQIEEDNRRAQEDEWSGNYTIDYPAELGGGTALDEFRWSPQSGFVEVYVYTCTPELRRLNYGSVFSSSSMVQLLPDRAPQSPGGHEPATRYLKVKWGARHYLIPEERLAIFCDRAAGLEMRKEGGIVIHDFYLKTDDLEKQAEAMPVLPPGYESFVKEPIDARITAVGAGFRKIDRENDWWDEFIVPVTINAGSARGVKRGMSFNARGFEEAETIKITQVGQKSSAGVIVRSIRKQPCVKIDETDDCQSPAYAPVRVGLKMTTRPLQ